MRAFHRFLQIIPANGFERLSFNLLNFYFFRNSEHTNVLFFGKPRMLIPLTVVPYILVMEIFHLRKRRYFIKFREHTVGIFAIREKPEALYISSLAVAPEYRRLGIGTYILTYADTLVKRMNKKWLELSVSKVNTPALRLYYRFGFTRKLERKWSLTLRKKAENC